MAKNQKQPKKFVEYRIPIAENYLANGQMRSLAEDLITSQSYAHKFEKKAQPASEIVAEAEMRDHLNYVLYNRDIQPLVQKNTAGANAQWHALADVGRRQTMGRHYLSEETIEHMKIMRQAWEKVPFNGVTSTVDTEFFTMIDKYGNPRNVVYNVTFEPRHFGITAGRFKGNNNLRHYWIGITDPETRSWLDEISRIMSQPGATMDMLDDQQRIAFDYFSRAGHSIDDSIDLMNKNASDIVFKKAERSTYATVENFNKFKTRIYKLGDDQVKAGANGLTKAEMELIDDFAEVLANAKSQFTGWNANVDTDSLVAQLIRNPNAEPYLQQRIQEIQSQLPKGMPRVKAGFDQVRAKTFDPFRSGVMKADGTQLRKLSDRIYQGKAGEIVQGMGIFKFENIAPALAKLPGLSQDTIDILNQVHHLSKIDVLQENAFFYDTDIMYNFLGDMINQNQVGQNTIDESLGVQGLLFQAKHPGSMDQIRKYNKNIYATIQSPDGSFHTSSGWNLDPAKSNDFVKGNRYVSGAFKENLVYEMQGVAVIEKDSELAMAIAHSNPEMAGEDLVRYDFRLGLLDPLRRNSVAGQELHSVYVPVSQSKEFFGDTFRIIGQTGQNGKAIFNELGAEQAEHMGAAWINAKYFVQGSRKTPGIIYSKIQDQYIADRAERSFTKNSLKTNQNVYMMRDIAKQGNFDPSLSMGGRMGKIQTAIREAANGKTNALEDILRGTNINATTEEIVKAFQFKGQFSLPWLTNVTTIAAIMKEGSLHEQLHKASIAILEEPEMQKLIGTDEYASIRANQMYSTMMKSGQQHLNANLPWQITDNASYANKIGRYVDDTGKFYVDASDFIRKYDSSLRIPRQNEDLVHQWLKIDLDNPYITRSEILRAAGITGKQAENQRLVRRTALNFADFMSNNPDLKEETQKRFRGMFNKELAGKSEWDIFQEITAIFKEAKETTQQGWAPEKIYRASQSALTLWQPPPAVAQHYMADAEAQMRSAARERGVMMTRYTEQKEHIIGRMKNFMAGEEIKGGTTAYNMLTEGFTDKTRFAMQKAYEVNANALDKFSKTLYESLYDSGIQIIPGEHGLYAVHNEKMYNLSPIIPKLRSNRQGILSWAVGMSDTQYIAAPMLVWNNDAKNLELVSNLSYGLDKKWFGGVFKRAIENGENPITALERMIKRPETVLREVSLYLGAPAADFRNLMSASGTGILEDQTGLKKMLKYIASQNPIEEQKEAMDALQKYVDKWESSGVMPTIGVNESGAIQKLIYGRNAILGPFVNANGERLKLNAGAKQTGSENVRNMFAEVPSMMEYGADPGKGIPNKMDNTLYFNKQLSAEQRHTLKGVRNFNFGAKLATEGEYKLIDAIDDSGMEITNRLRLHTLEADDMVKEQLAKQIRAAFKGDNTVADHFIQNFMPYEGGGWINGRIADVFPRYNTWQTLNLTPNKGMWGTEGWKRYFKKNAELRFRNTPSGRFFFEGYGRGIFVRQGSALYHTYDDYNQKYRAVEAKADSILSVAYTTKDGRNIIDEDTLRKTVQARLKQLGLEETEKNWFMVADSMYKRQVIAKRVFDEGMSKVITGGLAHESVSGIRSISNYFNDGTKAIKLASGDPNAWKEEEKLLHEIFYSDEFDKVAQRIGKDFRTGRSFSYDIYQDIANMNFNSPIFRSTDKKNPITPEELRTFVRNKVATYMGLDPNQLSKKEQRSVVREFKRMMEQARYRTSDIVKELTNADFLSQHRALAAKYENQYQLITSTIAYLEKEMQKNRTSRIISRTQEQQDIIKAVQIFNQKNILSDVETGRILTIDIDQEGRAVLPQYKGYKINEDRLLELYGYDGSTDASRAAATRNLNKMFTEAADIEMDANGEMIFRAVTEDGGFSRDVVGSDKLYKVTDRELSTYSNTLVDSETLGRIKQSMGDDAAYQRVYGRFLDGEGNLKQEFLNTPMFADERKHFFQNYGHMRWENGWRGEELFDPRRVVDPENLYRQEKTADLVSRLQARQGGRAFVAQSYADDLYEYASLRQANAFNKGNLRVDQLISDNGKIAEADLPNKQFFKERHLSEILTGADHSKAVRAGGAVDLFSDNLIIDFTDEAAGLNNMTLRRTRLAIAGIDTSKSKDIAPTEFQKKIQSAQNQLNEIKGLTIGSDEYKKALAHYNTLIAEIDALHTEYAENKVKTGKPAELLSTRMPASINRKVQVVHGGEVNGSWDMLERTLKGKTYNGEDLIDLYKRGKKPNFAIISIADLEDMGFDEKYFKRLNIDRAEWLKRAETEGIQGIAHRWPTDYLGSTMAVQIYVDSNRKSPGSIVYDHITAAFLKADSDGDFAQLQIAGATDSYINKHNVVKARYVDTLSKSMGATINNRDTAKALEQAAADHEMRMMTQIHDVNNMVDRVTKYRQAVAEVRDKYVESILNNHQDVVGEVLKKRHSVTLSGEIMATNFDAYTAQDAKKFTQDFIQYRTQIGDALNQIGYDQKFVDRFMQAEESEAAGILQSEIAMDRGLGKDLYKQLGTDAETINQAFIKSASTQEGRRVALNRIMRKGVGQADTPFEAVGLFREHAAGSGRNVISQEENAAMQILKEMDKEQLLTSKKAGIGMEAEIEKNLADLNDLMNRVFKDRGQTPGLRQEFVDFMKRTARDPNDRYMAESLLKNFEIKGTQKIDVEKLWGTAYDGIIHSVNDMADNTAILDSVRPEVSMVARIVKGREVGTYTEINNFVSNVLGAIDESNNVVNMNASAAARAARRQKVAAAGQQILNKSKQTVVNGAPKVIHNFTSGKSLAIAALGIASAAVFGGYAGGNPARPAQQHAQEIQESGEYEQNPPPRNITMADPGLTPSSRKQPGYVININAQTDKDKTYASNVITQAVTQNFRNTNVNVAMNVNQQYGNISGNDLMDYLSQVL